MKRSHSRRRQVLFRAVAVLLPVLIGAFGSFYWWQHRPLYLEEVVRPGLPPTRHRFVYDELLGWKNIAGERSTTHGRPLTINSLGMRGRERPREKPPGTKRILVLGDSFAWGYGVADKDVFTEVLEERLADAGGAWEVWNASVLGWGTDQEYLFLRRDEFDLAPDIVVVAMFVLNDPVNNVTNGTSGWYKPMFADAELADLLYAPCPKPHSGVPVVWNLVDPVKMTVALLERMAQDCREHQCRLVVMKFGDYLDAGPDVTWLPRNLSAAEIEDRFQRAMQPLVERSQDFDYLDLDEAFAARGLGQPELDSKETSHWTPLAHETIAAILLEFLIEKGLVEVK